MSKNKFKVGDEVRYINEENNVCFSKTGVIKEIDGSAVPYRVYLKGIGNYWCSEDNLELVVKNTEIKVGDKVRCNIFSSLKGYVGTVAFVDVDVDNFCAVDFGKDFKGHKCQGHILTNTGFWCKINELEIVEDTPTEIQAEPIRDLETGSLPCCEPDACMPVNEVPEDAKDCPDRALSCCLDEVPVVPERYFDAHYGGDVQPIELMQMILTPEQFIGFLMGNIIKYSMRCGKKDAPEKELTKIRRYKAWLDQARNGEIINPRV